MQRVVAWFQAHAYAAHVALIALAFFVYMASAFQYPLVDYDEATYGKLVVDTLREGDLFGFQLNGETWLQKPPLYFWMAMGAVKLFGQYAWVFRWPSILASVMCVFFTFLITKELVNRRAALIASFVLLFSPLFYVFAREARPDSGMIMGMLAALYFFIRGWEREKSLLWVFPAIAIGLLFKNAIALLIVPIILLYALLYKQWGWLTSRYLWLGCVLSILIFLPWHVVEALRYGSAFWDSYVVSMLFYRTFESAAGGVSLFDYLPILWSSYKPWAWVLLGSLAALLIFRRLRQAHDWKPYIAALISGTCIVVLFSFAKTHLPTYIMPAFPFFAIAVGVAVEHFSGYVQRAYLFLAVTFLLVLFAAVTTFSSMNGFVVPFYFEERDIGKIYAARQQREAPLYVLQWPHLWSLSYYGDTTIRDLKVAGAGKILEGPLYFTTTTYFGKFFSGNKNVQTVFEGEFLVLLYTQNDLTVQFDQN